VRAVVGIPVAVDFAVAIFTNKIFYVFDKSHDKFKYNTRYYLIPLPLIKGRG
jgi:hypothetical protein